MPKEITFSIDGVIIGTATDITFSESKMPGKDEDYKQLLDDVNIQAVIDLGAVFKRKSKDERLPKKLRKGWFQNACKK